ncbi:MAG: hypothetical protein WCK89_11675 [bacterium]
MSRTRTDRFAWLVFGGRGDMEEAGILLLVVGGITFIVGGIKFLIAAFSVSVWWGMGVLFLPVIALVFCFDGGDTRSFVVSNVGCAEKGGEQSGKAAYRTMTSIRSETI